jgi:hypothetical protein
VCPSFPSVAAAKAACATYQFPDCSGVTTRGNGSVELRKSAIPLSIRPSANETSYVLLNPLGCKQLPPDPVWLARAQGAYGAIARADGPTARWVLQGWMLNIKGTCY